MTPEEARLIAVIFFKAEKNRARNSCMYEVAEEYEEALNIIKNSIEKQIPEKPKGIFCPVCGRVSIINCEMFKYCWNCGQAIDWSGVYDD